MHFSFEHYLLLCQLFNGARVTDVRRLLSRIAPTSPKKLLLLLLGCVTMCKPPFAQPAGKNEDGSVASRLHERTGFPSSIVQCTYIGSWFDNARTHVSSGELSGNGVFLQAKSKALPIGPGRWENVQNVCTSKERAPHGYKKKTVHFLGELGKRSHICTHMMEKQHTTLGRMLFWSTSRPWRGIKCCNYRCFSISPLSAWDGCNSGEEMLLYTWR